MISDMQYRGDDDDNNKENCSVGNYRRSAHFGSSVQYTSSMVVNIRQLQTELHAQHEHEKNALTELNQRFRVFVDHVQLLESQNSKYLVAVGDARRQRHGGSTIDASWHENYLHLMSDLAASRNGSVDFKSDFEWYQLQIGIYQQLIDVEQGWKDSRQSKLEQELKQLASVLVNIRTSYGDLERVVVGHYTERDNLIRQYITLTHDWCNIKKHRCRWDLSMESLKSYIAFYKNLRSYSGRDFESSQTSTDVKQFWTMELEKSVQKIRRDFEVFYSALHREMSAYYEKKIEEVRIEVEQPHEHHEVDTERYTISIQKLQVTYEEVQASFSYEKEILTKLEATYSKLQSEFKSIEIQNEQRFAPQSQELQIAQENIMIMATNIDEMRLSKINLEVEIIVYRHILDSIEIQEQMAIGHHTHGGSSHRVDRVVIDSHTHDSSSQVVDRSAMTSHTHESSSQLVDRSAMTSHTHGYTNEVTAKFVAKRKRKGPIGIRECSPTGAFISLENHSSSKDVDISRWVLRRHIDSTTKIQYIIPDGTRLQSGKELKIYAKRNGGEVKAFVKNVVSSLTNQELVNNDIISWGTGNTIETILYNRDGEEEASYSQSITQ